MHLLLAGLTDGDVGADSLAGVALEGRVSVAHVTRGGRVHVRIRCALVARRARASRLDWHVGADSTCRAGSIAQQVARTSGTCCAKTEQIKIG